MSFHGYAPTFCLSNDDSLTSQSLPFSFLQRTTCSSFQCLATLRGSASYLSSLTLAGKLLYSGSSDGQVRYWKRNPPQDLYNEEAKLTNLLLAKGKGAVKSIVASCDKLFTAHQDHKIRVWRINSLEVEDEQTCTHLVTLPTLADRASKLLSPKNQVTVRRHKTSTWVHHNDTVSALALSQDQSLLYSVSWDRTLKIWRIRDFKCLQSVNNAHEDAINAVTTSCDGDIFTASADCKIKVWRKLLGDKKYSLVTVLEKHRGAVNALALKEDGSVLFSGSSDRLIGVWRRDSSGLVSLGFLRGHSMAVLCLFSVNDVLFSGSADKTVRVWRGSGNSFSCWTVVEGHASPIKSLAATPDPLSDTDYVLYSGSLDNSIKVWQIHAPSF